jgi:hypothetical protein
MTVSAPAQAAEMQRTSEEVKLGGYLGTPPTVTIIDLRETKVGHTGSPDDLLDGVVSGFSTTPQVQVLGSAKKSINGKPALVLEVLNLQGKPLHALQAYVVSGAKVFIMTCGALPAEYPKVESLCRTVANSIQAP